MQTVQEAAAALQWKWHRQRRRRDFPLETMYWAWMNLWCVATMKSDRVCDVSQVPAI